MKIYIKIIYQNEQNQVLENYYVTQMCFEKWECVTTCTVMYIEDFSWVLMFYWIY